ncbi:HdeD family acid-resistance protein [Microbacterium sp.]|uniref:HdeD family acid-resistance protein n=1 Tax=Microbacterium sp. TaxID=51671 RepID=UPI003F72CBBE
MSTESPAAKSAINGVRTALGIGGLLAVIAGIIILLQPASAAAFVTIILAIYLIAAGLVYAGLGIFSKTKGGWARVGHILLGIFFIIVGIVALVNLQPTTAWLAVIVAILVGIAWIVEGIVSLSTLSSSGSKGWTIFFAIVSIIAGLYLVFSPLLGALALWLILGIALVVIGILNIVRAFTFKGDSL